MLYPSACDPVHLCCAIDVPSGQQRRGYSATNSAALSVARGNEATDQILGGNDPAKVVVSIDDGG